MANSHGKRKTKKPKFRSSSRPRATTLGANGVITRRTPATKVTAPKPVVKLDKETRALADAERHKASMESATTDVARKTFETKAAKAYRQAALEVTNTLYQPGRRTPFTREEIIAREWPPNSPGERAKNLWLEAQKHNPHK